MKNWGRFRKSFHTYIMVFILIGLLPNLSFGNLLLNPGFEEGTNNPWNEQTNPDYWWKGGSGGWSAWKNNAPAVGATGANYVNTGAYYSGEYVRWGQTINVSSGSLYTLSVDAKTEHWNPVSYPNGALLIEWKNSSNNRIGSIQRLELFNSSENLAWSRYTFTKQAPAGAVSASFMLEGALRGTILYDEACVLPDPDFDNDCRVDLADYNLLANKWQQNETNLDLSGDNLIGIQDLKVFAEQWLNYYEPVDEGISLTVNDSQTYQQIEGFGASLTDSSAYLLYNLNAQKRAEILTQLFDSENGIGLNFLRQPMGTSDMRRRADYSYDEIPGSATSDYNLQFFSISPDAAYITPVLLEAMVINPDIKIMGSPWSAPKWMKTSKSFTSGSLIDDDNVYNTYANYFVRYIQAYANLGIDIHAITVQNEPLLASSDYPVMAMSTAEQIRLIKLVGQKFIDAGITTKIFCYDHNWDNTTYPLTVLADSLAASYIAGTAFHGYSGDVAAQSTVYYAHTDKDIYYTEWSDGGWLDKGFSYHLINNSETIIDVLRNWSKTFVKWNLALDQNNGPKIAGGCGQCYGVVTVNTITGEVTPRPQYYSLGQISKFVQSGAYRINTPASVGSGIKNIAFVNPDGSRVCMAVNTSTSSHNLKIIWNSQYFIYTLPAESVTTFIWPNQANAFVEVCITTGDQSKLLEEQDAVQFHN
ncbi:MAG: glycoside hydrolase family 30 beta sandwich domain-containing protein [Phycisphaerales bacterium]